MLLVGGCLTFAACSAIPDSVTGSVKGTMKSGTQMWKDIMEPRPEISLDPSEFGEAQERKLASLLKPVDEQVYQLTVYMDGEDKLPPESWFRRLFERFSWISGVMVLDRFGNVQFQHPVDFSKPVDTAALIALGDMTEKERKRWEEYSEKVREERARGKGGDENATAEPETAPVWLDHKVRAMSNDSSMGPEIFLAQPVFRKNEFDGLVVVHFDPRNLLKFCPTPDELMIMTQKQVIWTSKYHDAAASLATVPWSEVLANEVYGSLRVNDRNFYWLGRDIGRFSLIYATAEPTEEETAPPAATEGTAAPAPEPAPEASAPAQGTAGE
ncbi:hypothetical protein [Megalodesulfovibrio paquesii]